MKYCERCHQAVPDDDEGDVMVPGTYWHDHCWTLMCLETASAPDYRGTDLAYWQGRANLERIIMEQERGYLH